ncbi:DUF4231 domain-containing protein [Bacillus licheniformis]|nr:DUF4231 domain-containing protein [Bacillus licheniformis]QBR22288.1 DUF4231 domain-containing protein [Bacillus licheniformis]
MTEEQYMEERLNNQIEWYDEKSLSHQNKYKRIKRAVIILAPLIPVLSIFIKYDEFWFAMIIGVLGSLITILEGLLSLGKHQENYIEYRRICETLKHEKYQYLTRTGVYAEADPFKLLVERIESIISQENLNWANMQNNSEGEKQ